MSSVQPTTHQQAARDAIMEIDLFPDLPVALRKALGYGPHCDMLQHLVHWFHPRHPSMKKRWTLWKTIDEWRDECGLSKRQAEKGRDILRKKGLLTWKLGQHSRPHYRVDWVALADALGLEFISNGNSVRDDEGSSRTVIVSEFISNGNSVQPISNGNSVRLNTEEHDRRLLAEESLLQSGGEPAFAEPPPPQMNGKREKKEHEPSLSGDKRHSENGHTPSEKQPVRLKVAEPASLAPEKPDNDALLAEVKEILDSESGRWSYACFIDSDYPPEKVAGFIVTNAEDIKHPDVAISVPKEELVQAVGYVRWEAEA